MLTLGVWSCGLCMVLMLGSIAVPYVKKRDAVFKAVCCGLMALSIVSILLFYTGEVNK